MERNSQLDDICRLHKGWQVIRAVHGGLMLMVCLAGIDPALFRVAAGAFHPRVIRYSLEK